MQTVIVEDVRLQIFNLNNTGKDYIVQVYAQDIDESDMYTVEVQEIDKEENYIYYSDSSGNLTADDAALVSGEPALNAIHEILFIKREHGIIRGF